LESSGKVILVFCMHPEYGTLSVCHCLCYVPGVLAAQSWCAVHGMVQWLILSLPLMKLANQWLWKKRF